MLRSLRCSRGYLTPLSWVEVFGGTRSGGYIPLAEEDCTRLGMQDVPTKQHPLTTIVSSAESRMSGHLEVKSQVISTAIPGKPFLKITSEVAIAGPELLFIDAAENLPFAQALLFGMEICGTYSLRASFPSAERTVYQVEPATSTGKIEECIDSCRGARIRGINKARDMLPFLMDNAASPMESVLALMLRLPVSRGGVALGVPVLNEEIPVPKEFQRFISSRSFYPDIYFKNANIDLEYESEEFHPDYGNLDVLDAESREAIVEKAKEDKQRLRLIQTVGVRVFPVTYDDFKTSKDFDLLIEQLLAQVGEATGTNMREKLKKLRDDKVSSRRETLLDSLLHNRRA